MKLPRNASDCALVVSAVGAAYANALTAGFQFDDFDVVVDQPRVHSLAAWWGSMPGIRPLLKLSYALTYTVSSSAMFFHLVNIGIHAANACLIFALLQRLTTRTVALITALVFGLHPVQTEAATYVTGRSSSLSTLFVLLTLILLGSSSWLSPTFYASAMMVKETAVMAVVPGLLRKRGRPLLVVLVGAAVVAAVSPVYRRLLAVCLNTRGIGTNLMTQANAVVYLMGQLVRLDRLNADPKVPEVHAWNLTVTVNALLIVSLIALGFALRRKHPEVGYGILWFFLWLVPTNTFLPRLDVANDRQIYLAMAGPAFLFAYGVGRLVKSRARALAIGGVVVVCVVLATATHVRNRVYADEIIFWNDVVAKSPWNARGFNNLGFALALAHRDEEADTAFREALRLDPKYVRAAVNLRLLREGALVGR